MELKNLRFKPFDYSTLRRAKLPCAQRHLIQEAISLQDIQNCLSDYPEYDWSIVKEKLEEGKKIVSNFNKSGKRMRIYKTGGYSDAKLEKMDRINYVTELLAVSPRLDISSELYFIKNKSIEQVKKELQLVYPNGKNYARDSFSINEYDCFRRLINAINLYEQQIERQYQLIKSTECNLLHEHFLDKRDIIIDNYKDIIDYLVVNNDKDLFWGKLDENERNALLSSVESNVRGGTKDKLADYLSYYTTFPEVEALDKGNMKVLQRFVK